MRDRRPVPWKGRSSGRLRIATRSGGGNAAKRKNVILPSMRPLGRNRGFLGACAAVLLAACGAATPWLASRQPPPGVVQGISPAELERHIATLSSTQFEGRAPGTRGEELTVDYLVREL